MQFKLRLVYKEGLHTKVLPLNLLLYPRTHRQFPFYRYHFPVELQVIHVVFVQDIQPGF